MMSAFVCWNYRLICWAMITLMPGTRTEKSSLMCIALACVLLEPSLNELQPVLSHIFDSSRLLSEPVEFNHSITSSNSLCTTSRSGVRFW